MRFVTMILAITLILAAGAVAIEPVCRIQADGGVGSGCFFHEDNLHYFALTNAHVAGKRGNNVGITLWNGGHASASQVPGVVVGSQYREGTTVDVAVVAVAKSSLAGGKISIIPLAEVAAPALDGRGALSTDHGGQDRGGSSVCGDPAPARAVL